MESNPYISYVILRYSTVSMESKAYNSYVIL